jgi:hypothetical protein
VAVISCRRVAGKLRMAERNLSTFIRSTHSPELILEVNAPKGRLEPKADVQFQTCSGEACGKRMYKTAGT